MNGGYDDDDVDDGEAQDAVSQQLLRQQLTEQHRASPLPSVSQAAPRRNSGVASIGHAASPERNAPRHSPATPLGATQPAFSRPSAQNSPERSRQLSVANTFAMEVDELANTADESAVLPLVMSDLDPRYARNANTPKKPPEQPTAPTHPTHPAQPSHPPSLSIRQPQTPHKTNGASRTSTTPLRQPVVNIPLAGSTPTATRPHPSTPGRVAPMAVSVLIPTLSTPGGGSSGNGITPKSENTAAAPTTKSPVVAVGRRSKKILDVRIKGGRPKGWKPGMSYREVALRNLGVDPSDPSVPPEILLPPRARKSTTTTTRGPGRPRLPPGSRPKLKPSQVFGKRVGRPPIKPIEAVQRSIFLSNQACFAPFLCEWAGCRAELQNMVTLRKHVAVVHGRPAAAAAAAAKTCQWRRCADRVPPIQFRDEAGADTNIAAHGGGKTFLEHMEYYHLAPLEWHRGDGFANSGGVGPPQLPAAAALLAKARARDNTRTKVEEGDKGAAYAALVPLETTGPSSLAPELALDHVPREDLPRYLLDGQGKQVTPLLRDSLLESSALFWAQEERGRRLKELYRQQQQQLNKRPDRGWSRLI